MIVFLYVDYTIFTSNSLKMFKEFKLTDIGEMSYFLTGVAIREKFSSLKFTMSNYNHVTMLVEVRVKLRQNSPGSFVEPTPYRSLVRS